MIKNNVNPFNPNSVVNRSLFAGRSEIVLNICKKLSQLKHNRPASFFIYGERGIGKTALAKLIKAVAIAKDEQLYDLNLLTSYYSVESGQDLSSVLQASVNNLTEQMDKTLVDEIGGRLGGLFKNGKFTIGAFGVNLGVETSATAQERDITVKDQTVSILTNILKAAREKQSQDGVLIIIDEIHNLKDLDMAASILRNISTTLDVDGSGQVAFLLIGYDTDTETFFTKDTSAERMFDLHQLDVMPPEEAAEILEKGFKEAEYEWDKKSLKTNIEAAGGYPHSIQVLGHSLIEADSNGNIEEDDWQRAIFQSAQMLRSKEFSRMYSFGKPLRERDKVLIAIAHSDKPLTRKDVKDTTKNISKELMKLQLAGAIKKNEDDTFSLHSQLFRTAILFDSYLRELKERPDKQTSLAVGG